MQKAEGPPWRVISRRRVEGGGWKAEGGGRESRRGGGLAAANALFGGFVVGGGAFLGGFAIPLPLHLRERVGVRGLRGLPVLGMSFGAPKCSTCRRMGPVGGLGE